MTRTTHMEAIIALLRSIAPSGLTIPQVAERLGAACTSLSPLFSLAERGLRKEAKLYKARFSHSVVFFANEADAKAFDIEAYHASQFFANGDKRSPLQASVYRFLADRPKGVDAHAILTHISADSGKKVEHVRTVVAEMRKHERIVGIGPANWTRYFAPEHAPDDAGRAVVLAEIEATRIANKAAYRARENARKSARDKARRAANPKPAKKPKRKTNSAGWKPLQSGRFMLTPKAPRPSVSLSPAAVRMLKKQIPDCEATIPDHVKVQVCPGYRGDVRYLPQTDRVIGGFATMGIGRYLEPEQVAA